MSLTAAFLLTVMQAIPGTATVTGQIIDENGAPIAGAVVDLYTAKPRVGLPVTCPSCYRDCAKFAKTDAQGHFSIVDVDPSLLFRVLVMAPGRSAVLTDLIDPAKTQLAVRMQPVPTGLPPNRMLAGRVLDDRGRPLAGAVVFPTGAKTQERRWWGALPGVDNAAVTDSEGRFVITSEDPKLALDLEAKAPGYAVSASHLFELNGDECVIRMRRGVTVSGRLTFEGQPVKHRAIGMVQRNRSMEKFVGETTLVTDDEGVFIFFDLQPNDEYVLYTLCESNRDLPVLKTKSVSTGDDGQIANLGELPLLSGLTLGGKVELPPNATIPANAKLRVSRNPAWDWCEVELSQNGDFAFRGLPPEVYEVSVILPGFEIDSSRLRYQTTGASGFGIRLRADGQKEITVTVPMKAS